MTTFYRRVRRWMPGASFWFFVLLIPAAGLHLLFALMTSFADWFNRYISGFFRALFAHLTNWIPFSLAETLVLLIPAVLIALIAACLHEARISARRGCRFILGMLSVVALEYSLFVLMFAPGYQATTLDKKLDLKREKVSADQLFDTALFLVDNLNYIADEVDFTYQGSSNLPYSYDEMNDLILDTYDELSAYYPFLQRLTSRVKPVSLSEPWTYTHISGVYTTFTGEANINVNYPDYVIPFTAAHELAHQRGIAREDEANFVAFLICVYSDDPYIQYSGLLNLYDYIASALYSASPEYYRVIAKYLDDRVYYDRVAYSKFFEKYRDNVVATVSNAVNDTYLTMQGTEGTRSYNLVVDLAVAFLLKEAE